MLRPKKNPQLANAFSMIAHTSNPISGSMAATNVLGNLREDQILIGINQDTKTLSQNFTANGLNVRLKGLLGVIT